MRIRISAQGGCSAVRYAPRVCTLVLFILYVVGLSVCLSVTAFSGTTRDEGNEKVYFYNGFILKM